MVARSRLSVTLLIALVIAVCLAACIASPSGDTDEAVGGGPMGIVDAIATVGPPVRALLEDHVRRGQLSASDAHLAITYTGSLGLPFMVGRLVRVDDTSFTIRTFLRKEQDGFYTTGKDWRFDLTPETIIERGLLNPVPLKDLKTNEILVVSTRDGVIASRVIGLGVTARTSTGQ
jgi:hypothetical protein